jgi:hypothetical protein
MLYVIKAEMETSLGALPPEQTIGTLENAILPSLEILAKWEETGKIKGGAIAGYRSGFILVDAISHQEVADLLRSLPFWGLLKFDIIPLQTFRSALNGDRGVLERFKKSMPAHIPV